MTVWRLYLLEINAAALLLYAVDKRRAMKGLWRVPEAALLLSAALGGSVGALAGMLLLRHKTRHRKFTLGVPLLLLAQCGAAWLCSKL